MRVRFMLLVALSVLGSSMAQPQRPRPRPILPALPSFGDSRLGQMFSTISSRTMDTINTFTAGMARAMTRPSRRNNRIQPRPTPQQKQALAASTQHEVRFNNDIQREDEVAPNAPIQPSVTRPINQRQRRPSSFRQFMDRAMGGLMNLFRRSTRRSRQIRSAETPENVQTQ